MKILITYGTLFGIRTDSRYSGRQSLSSYLPLLLAGFSFTSLKAEV